MVNALLFFNTDKTYVDNLVFNYNLSSFLLIILATFILAENYFSMGVLVTPFLLGIFYYTYKSIRLFYQNKRFWSLFKTTLIGFFYPTFLFMFLSLLVVISFILY